jgi:plasmid stabilization system protein ParE
MAYPLIIEPEAELDLEQAVTWYNDQRPGLGSEFLEQVEAAFDRIREMPQLHAIAHGNARLTLVKRFPYVVCYIFNGEKVFVIAVFHGHRDPNAWKHRVP